jgi:hypothetical protein
VGGNHFAPYWVPWARWFLEEGKIRKINFVIVFCLLGKGWTVEGDPFNDQFEKDVSEMEE